MLLTSSTRVRVADYDDHPTLHLARQELGQFLHKSPGVEAANEGGVEIRFLIAPELRGYRVRVHDEGLEFAGKGAVEVLYSVYHFAERYLGFCFFEPGVDRLRRRERVDLPQGTLLEQHEPLLKNRGFIQEFPPSEDACRIADWMARNRLNYLLTWMKYYDEFSEELKGYYRDRGIRIESGHHNFDYYIPLERYHEAHPEYFAIRDGQRIRPEAGDATLMSSKQLCTTDPGLRDELVQNMVRYAQRHAEVDTLSLIPNDGFGWCECENCRRFYDQQQRGDFHTVAAHVYPAQDLYHDLVQDVAGRLREKLPHVQLTLCAYVNYVDPAEGFTLEENLAVHLAPYWRCINHRLDDAACPINQRYMQAIRRWNEVKQGGEINLYEYYMGVNLYVSLPMVHHARVFAELSAAAEQGVDGVLTQFNPAHWTAYGLNYYLMAKAAYGEGEGTIHQAFEDLFGQDYDDAWELYAALRELQDSAGPCHIPVPRLLLNRTDVALYEQVVDLAERLAGQDPADAFRQALLAWTRYLLRFKQIFDRYQRGEDVRPDLDAFLQWAEDMTREHRVCVVEKLRRLLGSWKRAIEQGQTWYHNNLDWEDRYVRAYERLLNDPVRLATAPGLEDEEGERA